MALGMGAVALLACLALGAVPLQAAAAPASMPPAAGGSLPSNQLADTTTLRATYIGLRHGESVPSSQQRICSSWKAGIDPRNGLTPRGRQELRDSINTWLHAPASPIPAALAKGQLLILSSPFSRTRESAEILRDTLREWLQQHGGSGSAQAALSVRIEPALRERHFGRFEGQGPSGPLYQQIWARDAIDADGEPWGVESAAAVQQRSTGLIHRLELDAQGDRGRIVVLVSHGDTLKILQTGFQHQSAGLHQDPSQVQPFRTAEFRQLSLR